MTGHKSINNLIAIEDNLKLNKSSSLITKIIAVSKTFPISHILPLINHGHVDFGENKVQEAISKWTDIKQDFNHIKLHMIGKLQTNKVKYAVSIFDYIHTLDNLKLAEKIANEQIKKKRKLKIFIQVNIGEEDQKNGIDIENLSHFYKKCTEDLKLDIVGLMCIPPIDITSKNYFSKMKKINDSFKLLELSMGMSSDYLDAIECGATYVRIGSKIFGQRS